MNRPHSPIITRIKLLHGRKSGLQIWNIRGNAIAPASGKALMLVVVKESLIREPLSNSSTRKTLLGVAAADVVAVEVVAVTVDFVAVVAVTVDVVTVEIMVLPVAVADGVLVVVAVVVNFVEVGVKFNVVKVSAALDNTSSQSFEPTCSQLRA